MKSSGIMLLIVGTGCLIVGIIGGSFVPHECPDAPVAVDTVALNLAYTQGFHAGESEGFRFAESSYMGMWDTSQMMVEAERLTGLAYEPYVLNCADSIATLNKALDSCRSDKLKHGAMTTNIDGGFLLATDPVEFGPDTVWYTYSSSDAMSWEPHSVRVRSTCADKDSIIDSLENHIEWIAWLRREAKVETFQGSRYHPSMIYFKGGFGRQPCDTPMTLPVYVDPCAGIIAAVDSLFTWWCFSGGHTSYHITDCSWKAFKQRLKEGGE